MLENKKDDGQDKKGFEAKDIGEIFLSKDGKWFHDGVEITHQKTIELFSRSVVKDPAGGYRLQVGNESARIIVEDTPYMVRSVELDKEQVKIILNDGSWETLDPKTLWIGKDNVLYCKVKGGEYPARFLRPAYYQLMQFLEQDGESRFYLQIGKERWELGSRKKASE